MVSKRLFRELRGLHTQLQHLQYSLEEEFKTTGEQHRKYITHMNLGSVSYIDLLATIIEALDLCNEQERREHSN